MESDAELLLNQATVEKIVERWKVAAGLAIKKAQAERAERALKDKGDSNASDCKINS